WIWSSSTAPSESILRATGDWTVTFSVFGRWIQTYRSASARLTRGIQPQLRLIPDTDLWSIEIEAIGGDPQLAYLFQLRLGNPAVDGFYLVSSGQTTAIRGIRTIERVDLRAALTLWAAEPLLVRIGGAMAPYSRSML